MGFFAVIPLQGPAMGFAGDSVWLQLRRAADSFYKKGDAVSAIQTTTRAIRMIRTPGSKGYGDLRELQENYLNLADYYRSLGQTGASVKALDSCIFLSKKNGLRNSSYLFALWYKTKYLFDVGDFVRCNEYATEGDQDVHREDDPHHYHNLFLTFRINCMLELKNFREAEKLLEHKVEEAPIDKPEFVWVLYAQMARVEVSKANYTKAVLYYDQAFRLAKAGKDTIGCLQMMENTGYYVYFKGSRDTRKALEYYRKAFAFSKPGHAASVSESIECLNLLTNTANAYVQLGAYDTAFHYFQLAFDQIGRGMNEGVLSSSSLESLAHYDRVWFLTALMIDKGDAWLKQYKEQRSGRALVEALRAYRAADKVLDKIKSEQAEMVSRLFWRSDSRRLFEHAIEASYLSNNTAEAFYFFEKSRSILLNDQILARRSTGSDDMLLQAQLKKEILSLNREGDETGIPTARSNEIRNKVFQFRATLDSLEKGIKGPADTASISLQDVRKVLLQDHEALVELFDGDSSVYALQVTRGQAVLTRIGKTVFDSLSAAYGAYVSEPAATNRDMAGWLSVSHRLYRLIFSGAPLPAGRIIISPDGRYFPFESLVTVAAPADPPAYFVKDHAVSYTYSARYLLNGSDREASPGSFMGMAPVRYSAALNQPDLPGSNGSLQRIGAHFANPKEFLYAKASMNNFMREFSKYTIIQLYTHASDSSQENGEPVIYFADSVLHLADLISGERPLARLIVLSACETGNGKLSQGEGVFSFNRGFAVLGIPSSLINLWSVDNESTYALTELFYQYLAEGMTMDLALQKAKTEFLRTASKEKSLPYYWAATVLTGRTGALSLQQPIPWQTPFIFIGIALVVAWIAWKFLLRR